MTSKLRLPLSLTLLFVAALGVGFAACKQGEGARCQTDEDCTGGLTCNQAEKVCTTGSDSPVDVPGAPEDAPPDAPPDAPIDAPPDTM